MAETAKVPKSVVLYIHCRNTAYMCRDCIFRKDGANKCALYGRHVSIKPFGGCGQFVLYKRDVDLPYLLSGVYTKENTGYVENQAGFTCGRCDEFLPDENDCKKIDKDSRGDDPGQILAGGCCNRWKKINVA